MKLTNCLAAALISLLLAPLPLGAQETISLDNSASQTVAASQTGTATQTPATTASTESSGDITFYKNSGEKHYVAALAGMSTGLAVIAGYNRFVTRSSWAKVTWDDVSHFYEKGLKWDDDWYWTNFVLHPYQGALPYMSARSSNLNWFESGLVSVAASSIWEWFCERNAPSTNDMVYSTVASVAVGEMFYRLSFEAGEVCRLFSYLFNPVQIVTTAVGGERPAGSSGHIKELSFKTTVGSSYAYASLPSGLDGGYATEQFPVYLAPEVFVAYDDVYRMDTNTPYDQFNLKFGVAAGAPSGKGALSIEEKFMYNIQIDSDGTLFSRTLSETDSVESSWGLCMDYNFRWHTYMLLSSIAPGFMYNQRLLFDESTFSWRFRLEWEALGTTDFFYFRRNYLSSGDEITRHYSYTTGAAVVLEGKYRTDAGSSLEAVFRGYAMYDMKNQVKFNGDSGWEFIGIFNVNAEKALTPLVHLGLSGELVSKKTLYDNYDNLYQFFGSAGVYTKFQLK